MLLNQIMRQESMIKESHREPLRKLIYKLQDKLGAQVQSDFTLFKAWAHWSLGEGLYHTSVAVSPSSFSAAA